MKYGTQHRLRFTMKRKEGILDLFHISAKEACAEKGYVLYKHGGVLRNSGAFDITENAEMLILVPRSLMPNSLEVNLYNESCKEIIKTYKAYRKDLINNCELYSFDFDPYDSNVGLYFAEIRIESLEEVYYAYKNHGNIYFTENKKIPDIQISFSRFKYSPPNFYGGIIYHIFVDRFSRDTKRNASHRNYISWEMDIPEYQSYPGEPIENSYLYGGTLYGIIDKLEYLKSLGVNLIYLSPIFESPSNHKYDTSDYMNVDKSFGGNEALEELIVKARENGLGIILDGVFNHTGSDSIYFNKNARYNSIGAYESKDSPYYNWYHFYEYPTEYECWWGIKILPRLNTDDPECQNYFIKDNGVISKYAKMGIAGFRLDVADELSDNFIKKIKQSLNKENKNSILYGEVWEDASSKISYGKRKKYYLGDELDGVMNYPLREGIIEYIRYKKADKLKYALTEVMQNAPKRILDAEMNILGSHDTERIITALGGILPNGLSNDQISTTRMSYSELEIAIRRLKSAYTVISTLPGLPCIYYGDEVLSEGYSDPFNRRTFPWGKENNDLLAHYKKIGKIRRENSVYIDGEFRLLYLTIDILLFVRYNNNSHAYYTLMNNSGDDLSVSFTTPAKSLTDSLYANKIIIGPEESRIFKIDRNATLELSL